MNKKNILIAAASAALAGAAVYLVKRFRSGKNNSENANPRQNHLTNVFSKAKQHATHNSNV